MKISLLGGIALAAALALTAAGFAVVDAKQNLQLAKTQVEQLTIAKAEKQAEVNTLAAELDLSEFTLGRVLAERESIAAIRARADAEAERLRIELADAEHQVAQLRVSHDEDVKEWANTAVPADALRLLKYAAQSGNTDSDGNQSGLQNTSGGLVAQLSADYAF